MLHRSRCVFVRLASALFVLAVVCSIAGRASGQNIAFNPGLASAYAGDPTQSHTESADDYSGPLSGLVLGNATSVYADANGNVYLLDRSYQGGYHAVLRVVASGNGAIPAAPGAGSSPQAGYVYQIAGNAALVSPCTYPGTATDQYGDGCAAADADLSETGGAAPGVAIDASGNIYLSDSTSNQIRVIYGGSGSVPGLQANPVAGNIYVIAGNGTSGNSGDAGPAASAEFSGPGSVSLDSNGNIYIGDTFNDAVRVIYVKGSVPGLPSSPTPGYIYTIAGTLGSSCAINSSQTCGDDGPATAAKFDFNMGQVALDPSGNIYIADRNNTRVRAIYVAGALPGISSPTVGDIYTVAGTTSGSTTSGIQATAYTLSSPSYLAFDPGGELYISDSNNNEVYKVDAGGIITVVFGGGAVCATATDAYGYGCATNAATVSTPYGIGLDAAGNLYVADFQDNLIRKATYSSSSVTFSGSFGLSITPQVVSVSNAGAQPLSLGNLVTDAPFSQVATGGSTDCGSSTQLQPGTTCQIGIGITPTQAGALTGTFQVSSNSLNATSGQNVVNLTANITPAASSTVLTASPAIPAKVGLGQPVTFTATVLPQTGVTVVPTGTVSFNNGATVLGTGTLNSGVATLTTGSLAAGSYVVTAVYSGDTDFSTSTSSAAFVTVASSAVPTVTLTASPNSATAGQSVTLTATVTPPSGGATPTGTIVFQNGVVPISSPISLDTNGSATFSTTSLPAGVNTLFAVYSGNLAANDSNEVVVAVGANAQLQFTPGVIAAIAGGYVTGYMGDGGAATSAEISNPDSVAYDAAGNLYFVDGYNNVIRVVASGNGTIPGIASPVKGNIYTVAGVQGKTCSSSALPCGDSGPATSAYLNFGYSGVAGVAVDLAGNLYIADSGDTAIRKVTPDGTISTVAGTLGSDTYTSSGDGGKATSAILSLVLPYITVDNAGNLYIIDGNAVRKVDAQTQIITTVAGSLTAYGYSGDGGAANAATLNVPQAITLDGQGNLYISDTGNEIVREVNLQTGIISTVAGYNYNATTLRCQYGVNTCFHGDGGPATQAQLFQPEGISVDAAGNLYIADGQNYVIRMVDAQTGIINTIAGQAGNYCFFAAPCGDGSLATIATIGGLSGITLDSSGDLTLSDSANAVRQITAGTTTLNFGTPNLGTIVGQSVTVTNTGSQPLTITGITPPSGFTQAASGGTDCTAQTTLTPAQQCIIDVQFFPTAAQAYTGTLTVASNSSNAQSGNNVITLSGTGEANSGTQAQSISFSAPAAPYDEGMEIPLGATADSGLAVQYLVTGPGLILNNGAPNASLKITGAGAITVTAYQFGNSTYAAATPVSVSFTASQPKLIIAASGESLTQGQPLPAYTSYTAQGFIPGDSQATSLSGQPSISVTDSSGNPVAVGSIPEAGTYNLVVTQGGLVAPSYYLLSFQNGQLTVTGSNKQTVNFPSPFPSNLTYGNAPIQLNATAIDGTTLQPDGNPISFTTTSSTDTIAGSLLTIGGAGAVSVTATQVGTAYYESASAMQSAVVAKAPLTVSAATQTLTQGVGLPSLNSSSDYSFSGFVNGETSAVLTGAPALTIVDGNGSVLAPGATPAVGTYTIQITQGSLSSPNYAFSFQNGTFNVVQGKSQTVTFPALQNVTYGAAPIALNASASSGLGVTYSVTKGPATIAGNTLSIHGAGTITVEASQPGNTTWSPASATQSFSVGPALLTVTAANVTRINDTPNPPLTGYSITGYVNGDAQAVVSGVPALSTTALPGSPVGTYPITITQQPANSAQNPITAANYTFVFMNGTLTITPGGPAPDFTLTAAPAVLGIPQGQLRQTTITLSPTNYYQGTVKLSCGSLPANMTCTFSPSALNPDGTGNVVTGTLTVNTNGASPVVAKASLPSKPLIFSAAVFYLPFELAGLMVAFYRKKITKKAHIQRLLMLLVLFAGAAALTACGGASSSGTSQYAAPGSYTVSLTAADSSSGASHSMNLAIDVQ